MQINFLLLDYSLNCQVPWVYTVHSHYLNLSLPSKTLSHYFYIIIIITTTTKWRLIIIIIINENVQFWRLQKDDEAREREPWDNAVPFSTSTLAWFCRSRQETTATASAAPHCSITEQFKRKPQHKLLRVFYIYSLPTCFPCAVFSSPCSPVSISSALWRSASALEQEVGGHVDVVVGRSESFLSIHPGETHLHQPRHLDTEPSEAELRYGQIWDAGDVGDLTTFVHSFLS